MPPVPLFARLLVSVLLPLAFAASGCGNLRGLLRPGTSSGPALTPSPPEVSLIEVRATHRPTDEQLAAHFCMQEVARSPLGPAGSLLCRAFGPMPTERDLQFTFDVELDAANPGRVPLPLVSALIAFTAYPDEVGAENLGSLCISLCEAGECPARGDDACRSDEPDITDVDSLARATVGFLVGLATGERQITDLRVRTIAPADHVRFVASLAIGVTPMTRLLSRVASGAVDMARTGRTPDFTIPWAIEGSVFVEVERFGRFAASFPETRGSWDLDATR